MKKNLLFLFTAFLSLNIGAQNVSLYTELHGHIEFDWFGNTHNLGDNSEPGFSCSDDNTSASSADMLIPSSAIVKKAILYWSGSGSGDFTIQLAGPGLTTIDLTAERTFQVTFSLRDFFGAAYDITDFISSAGSGNYTLSGLNADKSFGHCLFNTIYSGWSILVIYEDSTLPFSTIKIFDGFETIREETKNFPINDILIESSNSTKLGVLAWEGDSFATQAESIFVNSTKISNALNPIGHIFNGSNTTQNTSTNYNMDLDIFDISSFVNINDTSIPVDIKTGGDVIFLQTLVLSYQNKLPDATITIDTAYQFCGSTQINLDFTINNFNSNDFLPKGTSINFHQDNLSGPIIGTAITLNDIPVNDSESQSIQINSSAATIVANIDASNLIIELKENNNIFEKPVFEISNNVPTLVVDQICGSDLPYILPLGIPIFESGTYSSVLLDINGCDSTILIDLSVVPNQWTIQKEICFGDSIFFDNQYLSNDTSFHTIHISPSGCDSNITFILTIKDIVIDSIFTTLCLGESFLLPDGTTTDSIGTHTHRISCDTLKINVLQADTIEYIIELPDTFYVKQAEAIILSPQLNFSATDYLWVPDLYLDCSTCLSPIASIFESTAYVFSTKNSNGCLIEAATFLSLSASLENDVFIPNSFSPNGDGQNDYFSIYGKALKEIKQVNIFDRWGNLLIDQVNMSPENIWDGRFRGKQIPAGTYIYQIQIEFNDGETINFSGDLNLWR